MKPACLTAYLTILLLLSISVSDLFAQTVEAFVDRETIQFGETIHFTIKWSGSNSRGSVNLDVLKKDFTLLGTTQKNQINMFEGQATITTELMTTLKPKHPGTIEIPSFQIGQKQTDPITLNVLPSPQSAPPKDDSDRFL